VSHDAECCPDCGEELSDFSGCSCVFIPRTPTHTRAVVTSMRHMMARKLAARAPAELALVRLSQDAKAALVEASVDLPIGSRAASRLRSLGFLADGEQLREGFRTRVTLSPLGIEAARIQSDRNRARKEKNEAVAAGE
jgi:hypothetical protein